MPSECESSRCRSRRKKSCTRSKHGNEHYIFRRLEADSCSLSSSSMGSDIAGSIARLINATRYSLRGLRDAWRTQAPFRYECYVLILVIPLGWRCGETALER